ncbi:MAG: integrase core domain-containing protein [Candidatus Synoicihabitans palmerolidicus]|nr:integrase core domain-containing protein [Candidatus Synoicihabitans palmerolidicus]
MGRSVKYEEVYLKRSETMVEAHANLETYLLFYNDRRPHSAHGRQTPSEVYPRTTRPSRRLTAAIRTGRKPALPPLLPSIIFYAWSEKPETITINPPDLSTRRGPPQYQRNNYRTDNKIGGIHRGGNSRGLTHHASGPPK